MSNTGWGRDHRAPTGAGTTGLQQGQYSMSMSRLRRTARACTFVIVSACAVASPGASPTSQSRGDGTRVIVEGEFSNIRYTEDHAYGQSVQLWRQGSRLLGLFMF